MLLIPNLLVVSLSVPSSFHTFSWLVVAFFSSSSLQTSFLSSRSCCCLSCHESQGERKRENDAQERHEQRCNHYDDHHDWYLRFCSIIFNDYSSGKEEEEKEGGGGEEQCKRQQQTLFVTPSPSSSMLLMMVMMMRIFLSFSCLVSSLTMKSILGKGPNSCHLCTHIIITSASESSLQNAGWEAWSCGSSLSFSFLLFPSLLTWMSSLRLCFWHTSKVLFFYSWSIVSNMTCWSHY